MELTAISIAPTTHFFDLPKHQKQSFVPPSMGIGGRSHQVFFGLCDSTVHACQQTKTKLKHSYQPKNKHSNSLHQQNKNYNNPQKNNATPDKNNNTQHLTQTQPRLTLKNTFTQKIGARTLPQRPRTTGVPLPNRRKQKTTQNGCEKCATLRKGKES